MRLGDFRKETANLSDDIVLDNVMCIQTLPGYYDGRPIEYVDYKAVYTDEEKIRFYMFDSEITFWDYCEKDKSYEENLELFLSVFTRGKNIGDARWEEYLLTVKRKFRDCWYSSEWQEYIGNNVLVTGKFYWFSQKYEKIWRIGYVGEDPDENQYLHVLGLIEPWAVSSLDLEYFTFIEIEKPQ